MNGLVEELGEHILTSEQKLETWGVGEWVEEPDKYAFEHKGYKCLAIRIYVFHTEEIIQLGHLCGYLTIPAEHPWNGKSYDDIECDVHGGLTFAQGEENGAFVIGFDCSHSDDITPGLQRFLIESRLMLPDWIHDATKDSLIFNRSYKNMAFVIQELKSLVDQAIIAQSSFT